MALKSKLRKIVMINLILNHWEVWKIDKCCRKLIGNLSFFVLFKSLEQQKRLLYCVFKKYFFHNDWPHLSSGNASVTKFVWINMMYCWVDYGQWQWHFLTIFGCVRMVYNLEKLWPEMLCKLCSNHPTLFD